MRPFAIYFQEAQLNEVLSASNLDPSALTMVTRKLEVCIVVLTTRLNELHNMLIRMYWTPRTVLSETSSMNWHVCARYGRMTLTPMQAYYHGVSLLCRLIMI